MSFAFNNSKFDELPMANSSVMSTIMQSSFSNYYQWGVTIFNLIIQLIFLITVIYQGLHKSSSFFKMHIILSISIIIRSFFLIFINNCMLFSKDSLLPDLTQVSLYADFIVDTFKNIMIFLMALNRCLSFIKRNLMEFLFDPKRYIFWVVVSLIFSIVFNVYQIIRYGIVRSFVDGLGFMDSATSMDDRTTYYALYMFPALTVLCYLILFCYFKNLPKNKTSQTGTQSTAIHLFSSLILNLLCSFYALLFCEDTNRLVLKLYYCVNQSPEIALPLIFVISNWRMKIKQRTVFLRKTSSKKTAEFS